MIMISTSSQVTKGTTVKRISMTVCPTLARMKADVWTDWEDITAFVL